MVSSNACGDPNSLILFLFSGSSFPLGFSVAAEKVDGHIILNHKNLNNA